ncbi:hypothetical protein AU198_25495 [Mycobacterium sp. GA-1199]|nr:hypothetical protein AU198_25495 [Mycobacterium sp. GA-1199]
MLGDESGKTIFGGVGFQQPDRDCRRLICSSKEDEGCMYPGVARDECTRDRQALDRVSQTAVNHRGCPDVGQASQIDR